ncbi:MAG: T9SS type A sorting domain-containing protein [Ignavibacteriales bacterium]|nr:MAG: T9SS type A sorting domain-containing protein [Ignavibacteriaceae bacterium]MBW7873486.1 T9SS type A sorting domain-containing protein [Ignavibacteria bacterium]MCZ2142177.1 T9SS type A sorting domain-containing protein [Ignavibacteriales bacterium]MBV6444912.1 hypothetical protein [Ignavibacteriaceae bacterium]MBZ0196525.1 T9SS type A sorting domain-containing protein [Ignavibacteriaceae bacterium]
MFRLKQKPFRFIFIFLLVVTTSMEVKAQYFDSLIFKTYGYFWQESVIYMGDQNGDGFDDFLICALDSIEGPYGKARFFYGGDPIDTIPAFTIPIFTPRSITACDINRDGYRDIITQRLNPLYPIVYNVYFGGPQLDTIVDYTIAFPDSVEKNAVFPVRNWPVDFDGDGFEELIIHSMTLFWQGRRAFGGIFVFKTNDNLTPMEYRLITDFPDTLYFIVHSYMYFGDIDGDGKDDMTFWQTGTYTQLGLKNRRRFYYGNDSLDFSQYYQFSDDTLRDTRLMFITKDMNDDGKDEIGTLTNEGSSFPTAISYGTPRPPDITPDVLLRAGIQYAPGFSPGDVNGDGYNDLVKYIPYYNQALFLGGANVSGLVAKYYFARSTFWGLNFGGRVGDVNGDGIDDICIGENGFWEHSPSGPAGFVYIYKGSRTPVSVKNENEDTQEIAGLELSISPNPTNGPVTVRYTMPHSGVLQLKIHDMLGREIFNKTLYSEKGGHTEIINFKGITAATGIYILSLDLEKGGKHQNKNAKIQYLK